MAVLAGSTFLAAAARIPVAVAGRSSLAEADLAGRRIGLGGCYRRSSLDLMGDRDCRARRRGGSVGDIAGVVRCPGLEVSDRMEAGLTEVRDKSSLRIYSTFLGFEEG